MTLRIAVFLSIGIAAAQSFEVASIRPHEGVVKQVGRSMAGPMVTVTAYNVRDLILDAYDLKLYQIEGASGWMTAETSRYDVSARAPGEGTPSQDQIRAMLRSLLAERFGLKFHRGMREMPVYSLVVAKGGAKLKANTEGGERSGMGIRAKGNVQQMIFFNTEVEALARQLSSVPGVDRPVIDKTGLKGKFDYELMTVTDPETRMATGSAGQSIFTLVEETLGLRLEPQKAPIEVLVIDGVERPSDN